MWAPKSGGLPYNGKGSPKPISYNQPAGYGIAEDVQRLII